MATTAYHDGDTYARASQKGDPVRWLLDYEETAKSLPPDMQVPLSMSDIVILARAFRDIIVRADGAGLLELIDFEVPTGAQERIRARFLELLGADQPDHPWVKARRGV